MRANQTPSQTVDIGCNGDKRCIILAVTSGLRTPQGRGWGGEAELDEGDAVGTVLRLVPYAVVALAAVVNNLVLTFL